MTIPAESLTARPGWAKLREAADELHAAELLIHDPIATTPTAVSHLREFWRAIVAASVAAGIGQSASTSGPTDPGAWLESQLPGLDTQTRAALRGYWRGLADEPAPSKRELRAHVQAARSLLAQLEPEIGGVPLHRRKRRISWAIASVFMLFAPLTIYVALTAELPGTGPWRASYYADTELESKPVSLREDRVDHDWGDRAPHDAIAPDKFSVAWDTCLHVDQAGPAVFQLKVNDGARLLLDGEMVIDAWKGRDPKTGRRGFGSAKLELDAGVHHLRVEYFENSGAASIELSASLDGEVPGPLGREHLSYPGDDIDPEDVCAGLQ